MAKQTKQEPLLAPEKIIEVLKRANRNYKPSREHYLVLNSDIEVKALLQAQLAEDKKQTKRERHLITIYPDMKFGEPTIDHHRITSEQIARTWWYGNYTLEELEEDWPEMNRGAVLVSCWYMARYGSRTWKKRWKDWLEIADIDLWHGRYKTCPMPPQSQQKDK